MNALDLIFHDRQPLYWSAEVPVYLDKNQHSKAQETLNRNLKAALEALAKEPGLEDVQILGYNRRVSATYQFYQDLNTVVKLGM